MNYLSSLPGIFDIRPQPSQFNNGDIKKYITVLGDTNTGKSSLLKRMAYNTYSDTEHLTIGLDLFTVTVNPNQSSNHSSPLKLIFWDTAGQERYRAIATSYCRGISVLLLVFSLNDYESFNNLSHVWLPTFNRYSDRDINETIVIVVGTKLDLNSREISQRQINNFMEINGIDTDNYIETSSKESLNIDKLINKLVEKLDFNSNSNSESNEESNETVELDFAFNPNSTSYWNSNCCNSN